MRASLLTPSEAAIVASVTVRDINRVIDEKILPATLYTIDNGRRIRLAACPLVGFYFRAAKALTAEKRLRLIHSFSERITEEMARHPFVGWDRTDWTVCDGFLSVTLSDFITEANDRSTRLEATRAMVVEDPQILGGSPVIRGTRIPVYDLAASVAAGLPRERILAAYLGINETFLDMAVLYAAATPVRGRPQNPPASKPISSRIVKLSNNISSK